MTSSSSPGAAVNLSPTSSHTVVTDLTVPNVFASPSIVHHLAVASHEDPVVDLESAPDELLAAVGGAGDEAQVAKVDPPAKVIILKLFSSQITNHLVLEVTQEGKGGGPPGDDQVR